MKTWGSWRLHETNICILFMCDVRMMEVDIGDHSVLLTRCNGKYSAIGNQCTHYGAPLSKGKKNKQIRHIYSPRSMSFYVFYLY